MRSWCTLQMVIEHVFLLIRVQCFNAESVSVRRRHLCTPLRKFYNNVIAGKILLSIECHLKDMQFTKFAPLGFFILHS